MRSFRAAGEWFFVAALVWRVARLWAGVRLLAAMFGLFLGIAVVPHALRDIVVIVLIVGALSAFELRRRREFLLLANLGTSPVAVVLNGVMVAVTLEALLVGALIVLW